MAISDEAMIESLDKLNKCKIKGQILEINPKVINYCETLLDIKVKGKELYYNIKTLSTRKEDGQNCPITSEYKGNNYKNDIGKEKTFLINKDGLDILDIKKSYDLDLTQTQPTLTHINGFGLITSNDEIIKNLSNIEDCKTNLANESFYSNNEIYYLLGIILFICLVLFISFKKLKI